MSDLIDLTSPENKKIQASKLPFPLIPLPEVKPPEASTSLPTQSRRSSDNNPFDMELEKTHEYLSKREDPFEIVWEKAHIKQSSTDTLLKSKRYSDVLKNNKTLDECSTIQSESSPMVKNQRQRVNSAKCVKSDDYSEAPIPKVSINPATPEFHDTSILSQSLLNDSFSVCTLSAKLNRPVELNSTSNQERLDLHNLSILDPSVMNDSFLGLSNSDDSDCEASSAERIVVSDYSTVNDKKIDRYAKLRRSFSQGDRLSPKNINLNRSQRIIGTNKAGMFNRSVLSSISREDPLNLGFMTGSINEYITIDDISAIVRLSSNASSARSSESDAIVNRGFIGSSSSRRSVTASTTSSPTEIADLVAKYERLKAKHGSQADSSAENEKNISDSVFIENDVQQLKSPVYGDVILNEMPPDDFISSSDSDIPVDNLIELQSSDSNKIESNSIENSDSQCTGKPESTGDLIKKLEDEFIEPENKLKVATLLLELEKIVKSENNSKAIEMLEELGKALGVKCESNVKLLEVFIRDANVRREMEKLEKSDEDNMHVDSTHKHKESSCSLRDNLNTEKTMNKSGKTVVLNDHVSPDSSGIVNHQDCEIQNVENDNHKLIMNLSVALQQLLIGDDGQPTVLMENLSKLVNAPATERKSIKVNEIKNSNVKKIPSSPTKTSRQSLNTARTRRSIDSVLKKPATIKSRSSISTSVNPSRRSETTKVRVDSPKREVKKRPSSDPNSLINRNAVNETEKSQPIKFKAPVSIVDKNKLRKKNDGHMATMKKGPLKAIIPIGSMQRPSVGKMALKTPPKLNLEVPTSSRRITSTPNAPITVSYVKKSPKTEPIAASTPSLQNQSLTIKVPNSPRHNMSWNISPVTPTAPSTGKFVKNNEPRSSSLNRIGSKNSSIQSDHTPEKPKRMSHLSRVPSPSKSDSKLMKRRSEPQKSNIPMKFESHKSGQSESPLKENNGSGNRVKPINLISKFHRRSTTTSPTQKENKLK